MRFAGCGGEGVSRKPPWKYVEAVEEDAEPAAGFSAAAGRKKAATIGVRTWLAVNSAGEARTVEAGKHAIMRRTGLPSRDLRILDPQLSYPSSVLGRERAIVINLEHIKAVITAHEVLILNSRDPDVAPFIHRLKRRLHHHHLRRSPQEEEDGEGSSVGGDAYVLEEVRSCRSYHESYGDSVDHSGAIEDQTEGDEKRKSGEAEDTENSYACIVLPFEFIALEACLEASCSCLEIEATSLENEAHPALDKLTSKISTLNLEHVRQIKSRLVAITGRVQKVRDELEHLLDDDEDMAEMYLTDKLLQQYQYNESPLSSQMDQSISFNEERIPTELSSDKNDIQHNYDPRTSVFGSTMIIEDEHESHTHSFSTRSSCKHLYVEELEMLLEAYFVQIDSTLNKLSTLREYVDDTEDYINIMLDDKQNHLLQMGVVLTTATLIVSAFVVLVGIFGMNIKVDLFDEKKNGTPEFLWTVGGGATGCLLLYLVAVTWCKHKGILE